jgi:hypothetical protein
VWDRRKTVLLCSWRSRRRTSVCVRAMEFMVSDRITVSGRVHGGRPEHGEWQSLW